MNIDSQRGGQWCDAVEQINNKVQQIMSEVAQIVEDLGNSDEGGSIGEKLVKAAAGYVQKFGQMVEQFVNVVTTIAEQIGKAVQFAQKVIGVISTVAKIVAVFV
ncbi:MAG TPA: hypothetical protein DCR92_08355 [Faecalibacterium sp.]|uniref:Uncharacterized protein n=2 Tax=Oscillospiraceae TaxID=216572 RepID=A0ACC9CZI4_9FIRM|nr:hypothetical protein CGS49_07335 [Faecalibacterium prausnitzii]HAQ97235.1 hypothetical protein [Faecalibacterium sp.]